ncbi:YkgJ family cysteine cluster protein [Desulforhopalus singaporensis]|uniref:Zinc-or iron-chelating domain-containing protein n=1 Tax=Desulforhopalus singaporensis TaxID=91360 RepID=A0A1H0PEX5_9BACT|nr:YkgJ family cysteine cluster protein [Desulforhopalus singaporensis]SDP03208.1 hypothetical protein SAMN05660330_01631 [Desulforhopalus singaporensis]
MVKISDIFTCKRCGYCCQGNTTVSLDQEDQENMIRTLRLSRDQVKTRYWRVTGSVVQMKTVDGHCIFYDEGCTVHEGRPWRCAQWPLHPSIVSDRNNFTTIAESCPGINREIGYEKFCEILLQLVKSGRIVC